MTIKEKIAARRAERQAVKDARSWENWDSEEAAGFEHGHNPPDVPQLDAEIARNAQCFPEVSFLESLQEEHDEWNRENGTLQGPGCTEPPYTADLRDKDRPAPDWTFTEWAYDRDYCPDAIAAVNSEYGRDDAEEEAEAQLITSCSPMHEHWHYPGEQVLRGPETERQA